MRNMVCVCSFSASLVFQKARKIDWPLIVVLESATVLGGFLGGLYSAQVPGSTLSLVFALVVVVAGILMIWFPLSEASVADGRRRLWDWQRQVMRSPAGPKLEPWTTARVMGRGQITTTLGSGIDSTSIRWVPPACV